VDATGGMVIAASYGDPYVASFPLAADGRIGRVAHVLDQTGPLGPHKPRQDASHPHSVTLSPDNRFAFVANLGVDRVFAYGLAPESGGLAPHDPAFTAVAPGAGPRHTRFSPDGRNFYVLDELDNTVTACRFDAVRGIIEPVQTVSTLPGDFTGRSTSSEIRIHPNGRFVYTANRGHDSIAVFARDAATGLLVRAGNVPTGGQQPRNFSLSPDGAWLLCANQATDNLTVFKVDARTGRLMPMPSTARVAKAVCVLFLP
jgi:6-phosphogluconolactonase